MPRSERSTKRPTSKPSTTSTEPPSSAAGGDPQPRIPTLREFLTDYYLHHPPALQQLLRERSPAYYSTEVLFERTPSRASTGAPAPERPSADEDYVAVELEALVSSDGSVVYWERPKW